MNSNNPTYLVPDWPAPKSVRSAITLRTAGCSQAPFDSFNLADHVGDHPSAVAANRQALTQLLQLPSEPIWLHQVHGSEVVYGPEAAQKTTADACYTDVLGQVCAVMTADCLPVLFCNQQGTKIAAAHAGWRGLCAGILRNTASYFSPDETIFAYLGPAIGPQVFEVGAEVREAFLSSAQNTQHQAMIDSAFRWSDDSRYLADLYALARAELACCGIDNVYGGDFCTHSQSEQFFSYRRNQITGRTASLVWLESL